MKRFGLILWALVAVGPAAAKVGGGDVVFEVKGAKGVVFSHQVHVSSAGLSCTECHDKLYVTKEKHKSVSMKDMKKGKSCGACHDGKKAFHVKESCDSCHKK